MVLEVDESETFTPSLGINLKNRRGDWPNFDKHFPEFFFSDLGVQVLDVDVGELFLLFVNLGYTFLFRDVRQQLGPNNEEGVLTFLETWCPT